MEHPLVPPRVRKSEYKYRINLALVKERIAQSQIVLAHSGIEREFDYACRHLGGEVREGTINPTRLRKWTSRCFPTTFL